MTDSLTCTTYSGTLCKCFVLLPADPTAPCLVIRPDYAPLAANASSANKFTTTIIIFRPSGTRWEQRVDRCRAAHSKTHNKVLRRLSGWLFGGRWREMSSEGRMTTCQPDRECSMKRGEKCGHFRIKLQNCGVLRKKDNMRLEICGLFLCGQQICDELAVNRDRQVEVTFSSSSCLFAPQGDRCWPHYREQTLHWWKPVGHAKYLVQYFNISSGPHSHGV